MNGPKVLLKFCPKNILSFERFLFNDRVETGVGIIAQFRQYCTLFIYTSCTGQIVFHVFRAKFCKRYPCFTCNFYKKKIIRNEELLDPSIIGFNYLLSWLHVTLNQIKSNQFGLFTGIFLSRLMMSITRWVLLMGG